MRHDAVESRSAGSGAGRGILILALETSCDDTAAAVVCDGVKVLSNVVSSQVEAHARYGGVVPELACRAHLEVVDGIVGAALNEAGVTLRDVAAIGVTRGPGLVGSLVIGLSVAKAMAFAADKPLVGINHLEGHIYAALLTEPDIPFPFVALVVSGGHTHLYTVRGHGSFRLLGRTRDDAAGEAFDKVAKMLGLGYPGGPIIDSLAEAGDAGKLAFPRPAVSDRPWDFSFSGLKTAVLYYLQTHAPSLLEPAFAREGSPPSGGDAPCDVRVEDVAAAFQDAVVDVLVARALDAARAEKVGDLVVVGGVAANRRLRAAFQGAAEDAGVRLHIPPPSLCTDNAAMVACAAYHRFRLAGFDPSAFGDFLELDAAADYPLA